MKTIKALIRLTTVLLEHGYHENPQACQFRGGL